MLQVCSAASASTLVGEPVYLSGTDVSPVPLHISEFGHYPRANGSQSGSMRYGNLQSVPLFPLPLYAGNLMTKRSSGGGWPAIWYTLKKAREAGGLWKMWKAMRSRNACKTCALGMGGQRGGMVNEQGSFPEVCKKSLQAMAADMQGAIQSEFWSTYSIEQLKKLSPRELESCGRLVQPVRVR